MTIHETHFLPDGDIDASTMHRVDEEIIAAQTKPTKKPWLAKSTPLPTIVRTETLSAPKLPPIKRVESLTATGLGTVLHQIEITGQDIATKKPASLMLLDETLTGDEINTVKIDDQGFVYTTNQDTDS